MKNPIPNRQVPTFLTAVYIIETFDKEKEGWTDNVEKNYIFNNSKINKVLPEDELLRTYDNVPLKAKALELVNDRLIFGNYVEGYDLVDEGDNHWKFAVKSAHTELVSKIVSDVELSLQTLKTLQIFR